MSTKKSFLEKATEISVKFAQNMYVRSIRDGFSVYMPFMIASSFATLFSSLIFKADGILSWMLSNDVLASLRSLCSMVTNGTNNIISIMIGPSIAFYLVRYKKFENPMGAVATALASMIILMPLQVSAKVGEASGMVTGFFQTKYTGTNGILLGMFVGLLVTDFYIFLSNNKKLQIKMPAGVPEATVRSFNVMIPTCLVCFTVGIISYVFSLFGTDAYQFVMSVIQAPLKGLATSPAGYIFVSAIANFCFTLGIHSSVVNNVALRPFLSGNFSENVAAVAEGLTAPHIISDAFMAYDKRLGGAGCTLALVIAIFFVSKKKQNREMAKIGAIPSLFNIGEPMIFGLPIMLNPFLMIPYVLAPIACEIIAYFATVIGFVQPLAIYTPNTTPIILSGFLAGAGDIKVCILQVVLLVVATLIYMPFIKLYERTMVEEEEE